MDESVLLTQLPYEMIALIGEYDWQPIISMALACKTNYNYMIKFNWDPYMPIYKKWRRDEIFERGRYAIYKMNMFCMLMTVQDRLRHMMKRHYYKDLKYLGEFIIANGILMRYGNPELRESEFKQPSKIPEGDINEFIDNHWDLDNIKYNNWTRTATMPPKVRCRAIGETVHRDFNRFDKDITEKHLFTYDFVHQYEVFDFTGVHDYYHDGDTLMIVTNDAFIKLDLKNHTMLTDYDIYPDGWYIESDQGRLNINGISAFHSRWLEQIPEIDLGQAMREGNDKITMPKLLEKASEMPLQNPYQGFGYTAGFWEESFDERPLPETIPKLYETIPKRYKEESFYYLRDRQYIQSGQSRYVPGEYPTIDLLSGDIEHVPSVDKPHFTDNIGVRKISDNEYAAFYLDDDGEVCFL